jgi:hypothetical protein
MAHDTPYVVNCESNPSCAFFHLNDRINQHLQNVGVSDRLRQYSVGGIYEDCR